MVGYWCTQSSSEYRTGRSLTGKWGRYSALPQRPIYLCPSHTPNQSCMKINIEKLSCVIEITLWRTILLHVTLFHQKQFVAVTCDNILQPDLVKLLQRKMAVSGLWNKRHHIDTPDILPVRFSLSLGFSATQCH